MSYWLDKVAVVTGGSAGLGRKLVEALAAAGARVVAVGRDPAKLASLVEDQRSQGRTVWGWSADVTSESDVGPLFERVAREFGRLDLLVNNVGVSTRGEVLATTPDEFRQLFETNFLSIVRCTRAAAEQLEASHGHLVNIGSLASKSASRYLGGYPASKFAVAAYSQQLRYELGPRGVHVLLVCPGPIARDDAGQRYVEQAAGLPESARRPGGGVKLKGIPPERLASLILRACQRRRAELVVPAKARLLFAIQQLCPALGDWILNRATS